MSWLVLLLDKHTFDFLALVQYAIDEAEMGNFSELAALMELVTRYDV